MRKFQVRDIIKACDESIRWRVVFKSGEHTWLFPMDDRLAWPIWRNTFELQAEIDEKNLLVEEHRAEPLSASHRARALARFEIFKPILQNKENPELADALLTPWGRGALFRQLKKTYHRLTKKVFNGTARKWWAGGMTNDCLTDSYANSGRVAVDREDLETVPLADAKRHMVQLALAAERSVRAPSKQLPDHTKAGQERTRHAPASPTVFRVDRKVLRVFHEYFKWKRAARGRSLGDAFERMCEEVLVQENRDGSLRSIAARAHPKRHVFEDWYYELNNYEVRRKAVVGEKNYGKTERAETGTERSDVRRIAVKAQGDATIWNIAIVTRFHGRRIIGPPIVFRIRCKRSGMLLGIAVTLASASWTLAAAAVANCLEDKVAFCKRYGLHIKPEEWPVQGLPGEFDMDRGETNNSGPQPFIEKTGVRWENLMGDRPDLKGGVESDFYTLQVRLNGKTPAASVKDWEQKERAQWKFAATLDIDQFMQLLLIHELDKMKQRREGTPLPARMIALGLTNSPLNWWRYSHDEEGGSLSTWTVDEVQLLLMRRATGSITERGLEFKHCCYLNEEMTKNHVFAATQRLGRKSATVAYDERLVDRVYITHIGNEELEYPIVCTLNDELDYQLDYFGKCFREVWELRDKQAMNDAAALQEDTDSTMATTRAHDQIVAQANDDTASAPDRGTKAQQKRDIPRNRLDELYRTAPENAFRPAIPGTAPAPESSGTPSPTSAATPAPAPAIAQAPAPVAPNAARRTVSSFLDRVKSLTTT